MKDLTMKTSLKLLLAVAALTCTSAYAADCYSEGVRVGTIQKFSSKGYVNKSYEGELVMEGTKLKATENGTVGGNVWKFSASDPAVAKVIDEATMSGSPVALKYCQIAPLDFTRKASFDTTYIITRAVIRK